MSQEEFYKIVADRNRMVEAGELERINKAVYERSDSRITTLYDKGRKWSLEYFEELYKILGTTFDHYYFESEVGKVGTKLVEEGLKKGIFEQSQGAIIFPGEKYGLHSRVFVNSQGLPTYEAKELGLAPTKYKDFKYDASFIVTGNEVVGYFRVLMAALSEVNPELGRKTKHIAHGMVRLSEGKMSSRTGKVITAEWMIEEVKSRVAGVMNSSGSEVSQEQQEATAEVIAVGAIKYSLLKVNLGRDIVFDFEKSLSLEGASGPYLQYTYARCRSILRGSKLRLTTLVPDELSPPERRVLRMLYRFPEVVKDASQKLSPSMVCTFAFELAHAYNNFYGTHRVLQADTKQQKEFRLCLTAATSQVLKTSLFLLGIESPERM